MKNRMIWTSALLASTMGMLATGCKSNLPAPGEAPIVDGNAAATDPAAANMAAPLVASNSGPGTQVAARGFAAPQKVSYPQQAAPAQPAPNYGVGNSQQNEAYQYNTQAPANAGDPNAQYGGDPQANAAEYEQYASLLDPNDQGATQAPPPLPTDYDQPEAPGPDYLWTPGYWDYATAGYYYVPGVWVGAPYAGALWTPGWWGFIGNRYRWHHGYWGRHVGYYGGINYGFGYVGYGYQGGYWNNDHFWYNRSVLRVNPRFVNNNVYQRNVTVVNREYVNNSRTSYVGGNGGLRRGPAPEERAALREPRVAPMQAQMENRRAAQENRQQFFEANKGRPQTTFAAHPIQADRNVQAPPRTMPSPAVGNGLRPGDNRPMDNHRMTPPINGNPQQLEQRNQQQQVDAQRQQNLQQRDQNLQQHGQIDQQRNQQEQLRNQQEQQRQQTNIQRGGFDQQHNQQEQIQNQQRSQEEQQRNLQNQQRQQADQQRQQQENVQRQQQVQNQQRVQEDQQRNQQQQLNMQREQQQNARQPRAMPMPVQHMDAAPRPAPAPHVEAPRPAPAPAHMAPPPAPHMAAPPAPHPSGGGGEHHR